MIVVTTLVAVVLLLAANALYVAAEFGAVAARGSRIRVMADEGNARARRLLPVVENPVELDRYIAACQVGITLSSLILGAYGQAQIAPHVGVALEHLGGWGTAAAHSAATIVVLIGLTTIQMVLGELVPKAVALQYPNRTVLATEPPMRVSLRLLAPLIWVFNGSGLALLRLFKVEHAEHRHVHTPAEIDLLLTGGGELEPNERRRLRRALWLSRRRAQDLMVPRHRVVAVDIAWSRERITQVLAESPYTRFPVYRGELDQVIGVLHTKDVVLDQVRGTERKLEDILQPAPKVKLESSADEILRRMREQRTQQAAVLDSKGRVAGVVTLRDVLADVFGSVADEYKGGPPIAAERATGGG
jgi:putative hemolysin